jgi:hypothetical protein
LPIACPCATSSSSTSSGSAPSCQSEIPGSCAGRCAP